MASLMHDQGGAIRMWLEDFIQPVMPAPQTKISHSPSQWGVAFLRIQLGLVFGWMALHHGLDRQFPDLFLDTMTQWAAYQDWLELKWLFSKFIIPFSDVLSFGVVLVEGIVALSLILGMFVRPIGYVAMLLSLSCWFMTESVDPLWYALFFWFSSTLFVILWADGGRIFGLDATLFQTGKKGKSTPRRRTVRSVSSPSSSVKAKRKRAKAVLGIDDHRFDEDEDDF